MRRMFRAASVAAAVSLYLVTSFAAPAAAQNAISISGTASAPISSAVYTHQDAAPAGSGTAAKDAKGQPTPSPVQAPEQPNPFSQLFGHAVQAIGTIDAGSAAPRAAQQAPEAVQASLADLVATYVPPATLDADQDCLASAVYFEARSETLEGQLAVAQVVLNRAASGRFPPDVCDVVTQKAQFSFVHGGRIPSANRHCEAWQRALAIAQIARERRATTIPADVLWYHASYVSPGWGQRLTKIAQIGLHIFYS
jgi:spore germination cell wall hydrolase CwlJ-like protein